MADSFSNARAYYDVTYPNSGDGFSIAALKNVMQGLGFMDFIPLQPRAHNPPDTKIMVRGRDASAFYNPVYAGDVNSRIFFASGDTPAFSAPVSNPRIDVVYITASGDIKIQQGTEAVTPSLPSLAPSGDTRFPVCAVYNKPGQARIVNFETKDASTGDGYIYQDLRPFLTQPKSGATTYSAVTPVSPTGDGQAGPGTASTAARSDHVHGGAHGVRVVGQSLIQGDVELAGNPAAALTQAGNRVTFNSPFTKSFRSSAQTITSAGALAIAHGLGATPTLIQVRLVNVFADIGYSAGDEVIINPHNTGPSAGDRGVAIVPDSTNINIRFGDSAIPFELFNKGTGTPAVLGSNAFWRLVVLAWA